MKPAKDVTSGSNPRIPPTHYIQEQPELSPTPARQPPIEPPKIVSGQSGAGIKSRESNEGEARNFVLPERMSFDEIREASYRFGGGRSAGNRSLADNQARQKTQR